MSSEILRKTLGLAELSEFARELLQHFKTRQVLLLKGPMGVGKTELVRALVKASGGTNEATSPSFAIHHRYEFDAVGSGMMHAIDHLDLYRIEGEDELESTGFWDLFSQRGGLILIEWAERIPREQLPQTWPTLALTLSFAADTDKREFVLSSF